MHKCLRAYGQKYVGAVMLLRDLYDRRQAKGNISKSPGHVATAPIVRAVFSTSGWQRAENRRCLSGANYQLLLHRWDVLQTPIDQGGVVLAE